MESNFGERLTKAIKYRGKRPIDVATATGISRGNLSKYMRGERPMPKIDTISRIANYLDVSVGYLAGLQDNMVDSNKKVFVNTTNTPTERELLIEEITSNITWLDVDTLKTINQMVKALKK